MKVKCKDCNKMISPFDENGNLVLGMSCEECGGDE